MDIFTMVITACISGQPACIPARISTPDFVSEDACYAHMGEITHAMTKHFAETSDLKGKKVTYDVSCMSQQQLRATLGTTQSDT